MFAGLVQFVRREMVAYIVAEYIDKLFVSGAYICTSIS